MVVQDNTNAGTPPPAVTWAQRSEIVFLTFCLEDCHDAEIKFNSDNVFFKGTGGTENKLHELTIDLCKDIDPDKCTKMVRERNIEVILKKKESGYWPHLTKEKKKYHWLKVDFNRWEDEESTDEEGGGKEDIEEIMRSMGGLGGGDGGKPSFDDLDDGPLDSDDEELPDLE